MMKWYGLFSFIKGTHTLSSWHWCAPENMIIGSRGYMRFDDYCVEVEAQLSDFIYVCVSDKELV